MNGELTIANSKLRPQLREMTIIFPLNSRPTNRQRPFKILVLLGLQALSLFLPPRSIQLDRSIECSHNGGHACDDLNARHCLIFASIGLNLVTRRSVGRGKA